MSDTKIEWTDKTWNPIVGCSIVSPGCTNCYAMKMAARIEAMGNAPHYAGTTKKVNGNAVWSGKITLAPETTLTEPLRRKRPTLYFVNSMGDLHHESISFDLIDRVVCGMAKTPQHTYQVLTKRAAGMQAYWSDPELGERIGAELPLPNVWLGVSCERQHEADDRVPLLLATPAAIRFVSAEPLLGPIDFSNLRGNTFDAITGCGDRERLWEWEETPRLDWVIVGGESGPGARPMNPQWARDLRDQCAAADVPFFFKQWGESFATSSLTVDGAQTYVVHRIGKKAAGRILDGREHNGMPERTA